MAWSDKLKLNKQLVRSVTEAGYLGPKELQSKTLTRIIGGQDIIAVGPGGSGKTTAYILAILNRLKYNSEGVPVVLVLVPTQEQVLAVISQFELLNKNESLSIVGLYAVPGIEAQMNALADGADIVVATPDRARAIYLKLGLNLNKINLLVVDDAELIVKQGLQLPVAELANSITKAQHLVFTTVMHDKLHKMIDPFLKLPAIIEVEELGDQHLATLDQVLYHVPNFGTKLNLLNLFMQDDELFTKTVLFINTRQTAEKIYKSLQNKINTVVGILNPWFFEQTGFASVNDFKTSTAKVLIVVNEEISPIDLQNIPFIIHFDLPQEKEVFINRVISRNADQEDETIAITFATDIELSEVKKIEQAIGQKITLADLPEELIIEKERKIANPEDKPVAKTKDAEPTTGEAFHQKKAANSKTYNFSSGQKAKMNKKRNH